MKKKEIQELKHRPVEELARMAQEAKENLRVLHFDLAAGKVKDISAIRETRRKVARIKTFIKEHERENGK